MVYIHTGGDIVPVTDIITQEDLLKDYMARRISFHEQKYTLQILPAKQKGSQG